MGDTDQGCGGDLTCNAVTGNNWYDHAHKQFNGDEHNNYLYRLGMCTVH